MNTSNVKLYYSEIKYYILKLSSKKSLKIPKG